MVEFVCDEMAYFQIVKTDCVKGQQWKDVLFIQQFFKAYHVHIQK